MVSPAGAVVKSRIVLSQRSGDVAGSQITAHLAAAATADSRRVKTSLVCLSVSVSLALL